MTDSGLLAAYTPEQQAAIDAAMAKAVSDRFLTYYRDGVLVQRGQQLFAVFGETAYRLVSGTISDRDSDSEWE